MRAQLVADLSSAIDKGLVEQLISSYEGLISKSRAGDLESALNRAGKFVEHTYRALHFLRTGTVIPEVKSVDAARQAIEKDMTLNETVRIVIPRIAAAMPYGLRSKRSAVHVKEIDPRQIDVALSVSAASWVLAEFIRLYHSSSEEAVQLAMASLSRSQLPYIEQIGSDVFVARMVPHDVEILLLCSQAADTGLTRSELGKRAKISPPRVTEAKDDLLKRRFLHKTSAGVFHITGAGEAYLAQWLSKQPATSG